MKVFSVHADIEDFAKFDTYLSELEAIGEMVELHICSGGGDIYSSLAYTARILEAKVSVTTVGYGRIMSAAVLPFIVGKYRKLSKLCWLMLHETQFIAEADEEESLSIRQQETEHTQETEEQYYKLLGQYTKKPAKYWRKRIEGKGNVYMDAHEALILGLCDETF